MMKAMTSAIAGLKAHQTAMDVVGNNIANVNTYAFKGSDTTFRDTMYETIAGASGGNTTTGVAGNNPMQIGFGATTTNVNVDTTAGSEDATGNAFDCYINGAGYFVVQQNGGSVDAGADTTTGIYGGETGGTAYTRVGTLQFVNGYLTDGQGHYILGASNSDLDTSTGAPTGALSTTTTNLAKDIGTGAGISASTPADWKTVGTTPAGGIMTLQRIGYDTANNSLTDFSIASDGTITATDANKNVVTIGRIAVGYFNNPAGLTQAGGSLYTSNTSSGTATNYGAGTGSTGSLITGMLEASNVDLATQLSNMIVYERGYQANTKIITVADEMLQTLVNMK